ASTGTIPSHHRAGAAATQRSSGKDGRPSRTTNLRNRLRRWTGPAFRPHSFRSPIPGCGLQTTTTASGRRRSRSRATRMSSNVTFIWSHGGGTLLGLVGRFNLGDPDALVNPPADSRLAQLPAVLFRHGGARAHLL